MSKFSNLIKLLTLLKSKKRMKSKELAEALDVSERMIRKYISDLIEAGIEIQSISGPNGGYQVNGYNYLIDIDIKEDERIALEYATKELKKDADFPLYNNLENLNCKINIVCEDTQNKYESGNSLIKSEQLELLKELEKEVELQAALIAKRKVKVKYVSVSSGESERVLCPYGIKVNKDSKYLIALCEKRNEIRTFKIIRFSSIEMLDEKYSIPSEFRLEKYLDRKIGLFNEESIDLKLLIRPPFAQSVSERIYSENQNIIINQDKSIIFKGTMKGKNDIIRWILSMRDSVTILEPKDLREEIRDELIKILAII